MFWFLRYSPRGFLFYPFILPSLRRVQRGSDSEFDDRISVDGTVTVRYKAAADPGTIGAAARQMLGRRISK
jgi:hypothetical protein